MRVGGRGSGGGANMTIQMSGLVPLLQVFDMNESVAFYRDMLGFEIHGHSPEIEAAEGRYFHWAWLRHGDAELMLNTAFDSNERPAARDPAREGATCSSSLRSQ